MKKNLILFLSLLPLASAHAGYNSDVEGKAVRCTAPQTVVIINAARTRITVIDAIDPGHPEKYDVVDRDTDGDTMISYISQGNDVVLSFDDQGDTLTYRGQAPLNLKCPQ
jgi:hypothetical protein